eukprot:2727866-Alexandrium_andersonii.AAC.1
MEFASRASQVDLRLPVNAFLSAKSSDGGDVLVLVVPAHVATEVEAALPVDARVGPEADQHGAAEEELAALVALVRLPADLGRGALELEIAGEAA